MNRRDLLSADQLLGEILRSVSRSFYLSIRILPRRMREPVGLAYLLARATDTVADTTKISATIRRETLRALVSAIQSGAESSQILDLQKSFAFLQTNQAERTLIESLSGCLAFLDRLEPADREDVRTVLDKITRGQEMDIDRFGVDGAVQALATTADLNQYTYLIAGSVGEFWTRVCVRHVPNFADKSNDKMLDWGKRYGDGLQLINILRDAGADLRAGRCYFPIEDLDRVGLKPSEISGHPARFKPVFQKWLEEAEQGIQAGMEYVRAIRERRIRGATVLPALIGARTLALLRAAGGVILKEKIKVPRHEVRGIIGSVVITLASRKRLDAMFQKLCR
jgi:farnesyl-diphosphate farnesyltransferase